MIVCSTLLLVYVSFACAAITSAYYGNHDAAEGAGPGVSWTDVHRGIITDGGCKADVTLSATSSDPNENQSKELELFDFFTEDGPELPAEGGSYIRGIEFETEIKSHRDGEGMFNNAVCSICRTNTINFKCLQMFATKLPK